MNHCALTFTALCSMAPWINMRVWESTDCNLSYAVVTVVGDGFCFVVCKPITHWGLHEKHGDRLKNIFNKHYSDITWVPWCCKSPATWLWQLFQANNNWDHKSSMLLALCVGNPSVIHGFPSQRTSVLDSVSLSWHLYDFMNDKLDTSALCKTGDSSALAISWKNITCIYCKSPSTSRTQSQNLIVSRVVLQLSLPNPLKPGVKSSMKM